MFDRDRFDDGDDSSTPPFCLLCVSPPIIVFLCIPLIMIVFLSPYQSCFYASPLSIVLFASPLSSCPLYQSCLHPPYQSCFYPSFHRSCVLPSLWFGGKYNPGSGETLSSVVEQWSRVRSLMRNSAPFRGVVLRPPLFSSQCAANLAIPFLPPPPSHHCFPIYCRRYPPVNRLLPRRLSLPDLPPWFRRASRSSGTLCAPPRSARPRTEPPRLSAARRRHLRCRSAEALAPLPQLPCTHCSHTVDKPLPPVIYLATLHSVREHHISTFGDARYLRALIARRSVDRIAALVAAAAAVAPALLVSPVLARAAAALGAARTRRARC